jgi:hypothetical protein
MSDILTYLFWPNPGNAGYDSPKATALIIACALMIALSFALRLWRNRKASAPMRKVSRSWASATFWFGIVGLVLIVARVEQIQFVAMRILWVLWGVLLALYVVLQLRLYKNRYYEVLPTITADDPRSKYLPKRKKR